VQKQVPKTGDFGIGLMIHAVHMTDDVRRLNRFYEEVFGGVTYLGGEEPNYLPSVRTSRPRAGLLAADPADTFSAPYFFTTDVLDNDPFQV
jgi:hypothetical protein